MNIIGEKAKLITKMDTFNRYDILGKKIKIIACSNKYNTNKTGIVVNETKNMLYLNNKDKDINKIAKKEIQLIKVMSFDGDYFINGFSLLGRAEERITKIR